MDSQFDVYARPPEGAEPLVGDSSAMTWLKAVGARAAKRPSTVMILGETGSGKEMLAKYIHQRSPRADKPFVPVDCTGFSETLFESQLFGHLRGAFTGAVRDTLGFVRAADGGTLFLDEIGELAPALQAKLLRVLQDRRVVPVGASRSYPVDIRVISATHRDLDAMVAAGQFRQDLLFRLQVITISVPPLRQRREDIRSLAEDFLIRQARDNSEAVKPLSPEAQTALEHYRWPGNVRELFNVLEQASVLADGPDIGLSDLPLPVRAAIKRATVSDLNLDEMIRHQITEALMRSRFRRTYAATLLGIERRRLNRYIAKFGIPITRHNSRA
ncbi:MAG TPA: sigma-54 dependent transcriptional regulator [Tepidisphaeraceae bacterium]|nr:sigma-54 dependent transcriptional regulator [Tepidisphaeraceae bacterium]